MYRLNVLETRSQCSNGNHSTPQYLALTRQVIAAILNIFISPGITADNRATLLGIAQHHVVVRPTLDPDSMVGLIHSRAATPRIRIRGLNQIPQTGTT